MESDGRRQEKSRRQSSHYTLSSGNHSEAGDASASSSTTPAPTPAATGTSGRVVLPQEGVRIISTGVPPPTKKELTKTRRRIGQACVRCRLRKTKCDGANPCGRCVRDDDVCEYIKRSQKSSRSYSQEYVENLLQQNERYKTAIRILYHRAQARRHSQGGGSSTAAAQEPTVNVPPVHEILAELGLLDDSIQAFLADIDSDDMEDANDETRMGSMFPHGSQDVELDSNLDLDPRQEQSQEMEPNNNEYLEAFTTHTFRNFVPRPPDDSRFIMNPQFHQAGSGYQSGTYSAPSETGYELPPGIQAQIGPQGAAQMHSQMQRQPNEMMPGEEGMDPEYMIANSQILRRRSLQRRGFSDLEDVGRGHSF